MSAQWRQIAGLLLMVTVLPDVSADERIGRLFSTPVERAKLDLLRSGLVAKKARGGEAAGHTPSAPTELLVLNGLVRRSNGQTTVWVNGQRLKAKGGHGKIPLHGHVDQNNRVKLRLSKEPKNIRLKPGQAWDPIKREVIEHYRAKREKPEQKLTADRMDSGGDEPLSTGP